MASVSFPSELFDSFVEHLNSVPESIAFMRCPVPGEDRVFRVEELRTVDHPPYDLRSDVHCELDDELRAEVIRWAWDSNSCLIEAHSHGLLFSPAQFSRFDLRELSNWVPHVRWRLTGRPYVALVTASKEIDGLAWIDDGPEAVELVHIDGREPMQTTQRSLESWSTADD